MALVLIPELRPWTEQPQEPVGIDDRNRYAQNLTFAWIATHPTFNPLLDQTGFVAAGNTPNVGKYGTSQRFSGNNAGIQYSDSRRVISKSTVSWLAISATASRSQVNIIVAQREAAGGTNGLYVEANSSGTGTASAGSLAMGSFDGAVNWQARADGVIDGKPHVFVGVKSSASAHQIYVDGLPVTTTTTNTGTTNAQPNQRTEIGGLTEQALSAFSHNEDLWLVFIWDGRALTPDEVADLSINPWQLFAPRRILLPFTAANADNLLGQACL